MQPAAFLLLLLRSLYLISASLIAMHLGVGVFGFTVFGTLLYGPRNLFPFLC